MNTQHVRSTLASILTASLCAAQQTIIVDAAGGAGSHFRTIPPAIAAAQPGDTVLVRAGLYREILDIAKGIRLIGQGARLTGDFVLDGTVVVHDLPVTESFAMRGFVADGSGLGGPRVTVRRCAGPVSLRDLRQSELIQFGLTVEDSRQVHVADVVLVAARSTLSTTVFERVVFDPASFQGLWVNGGSVDCSLCSIRGSFNTFAGPGVLLSGGRVRLTGSTVQGTGASGFAHPAIHTSGGEVHLDPTTVLQPATGAQPITGPAIVVRRELTALRADSNGSRLTADLHGPSGADFVTLATAPSATVVTPFGDLWLNTDAHVIVDFGTLDSTRRHQWSLAHPPVPSGFTITMQTVTFATTFELSMPTIVAFP